MIFLDKLRKNVESNMEMRIIFWDTQNGNRNYILGRREYILVKMEKKISSSKTRYQPRVYKTLISKLTTDVNPAPYIYKPNLISLYKVTDYQTQVSFHSFYLRRFQKFEGMIRNNFTICCELFSIQYLNKKFSIG